MLTSIDAPLCRHSVHTLAVAASEIDKPFHGTTSSHRQTRCARALLPEEGVAARRLAVEAGGLRGNRRTLGAVSQTHVTDVAECVDALTHCQKAVQLGVPRVLRDLGPGRTGGLLLLLRRLLLLLWRLHVFAAEEISYRHRRLRLLLRLEHWLLRLLWGLLLLLRESKGVVLRGN